MFLHNYANAIWSLKRQEGSHLFVLVTSFIIKISITFQRMQASSILSQTIVVSLFTSRLSPPRGQTTYHHDGPITSDWFLTRRNATKLLRWSIFDLKRFWHLVWANLTSYTFALFIFVIPLYIFQIYGVLIKKVLQGCIKLVRVNENENESILAVYEACNGSDRSRPDLGFGEC